MATGDEDFVALEPAQKGVERPATGPRRQGQGKGRLGLAEEIESEPPLEREGKSLLGALEDEIRQAVDGADEQVFFGSETKRRGDPADGLEELPVDERRAEFQAP